MEFTWFTASARHEVNRGAKESSTARTFARLATKLYIKKTDLGCSAHELWIGQTRQFAGAVTQRVNRSTHSREHRAIKIAERGIPFVEQVPSGSDCATAFTGEDKRQIMRIVFVAVAHARAEKDHGIVQQCALAFFDGAEFVEEVRVLLDVPRVDPLVFRKFLLVVLVMRSLVVRTAHAWQKRKTLAAYGVSEHERRNAC